jgi:hypothetical protein
MTTPTRAMRMARFILITACLLLPTLSLLPLGGMYLWEKGWLLHWAVLALCVSGSIALLEAWLLKREARETPREAPLAGSSGPSAVWDEREVQAWRDVEALAARLEIERLDSTQAFLDLGLETVTTVARRLHPEKPDPLWQFTMPEALAITERVSRRLSRTVVAHVPFGDRLTLAQFRAAYRWRGAIGVAERAYDIWRIVRLMNPATAVANEARERVSRAVLNWGREQVTRRLAESFVEEVGRAAIDLYGGRLRLPGVAADGAAASAPAPAPMAIEAAPPAIDEVPITIAICGGSVHEREALEGRVGRLDTGATPGTAPRLWPPLRVTTMEHDLRQGSSVGAAAAEASGHDVVLLITRPGPGIEPDISAFIEALKARRAPDKQRLQVLYPLAVRPDGEPDIAAAADVAGFARSALSPPLAVVGLKRTASPHATPAERALAYENGLWRAARLVLAKRRRTAAAAASGPTSMLASGVQGVTAAARSIRALFRRRAPKKPSS